MGPNFLNLIKTPKIFGKKKARNSDHSKDLVAKQIKYNFFSEINFYKNKNKKDSICCTIKPKSDFTFAEWKSLFSPAI